LLDNLSAAEARFANHEITYRLLFKALRSREEAYVALRKSRDSLQSKIDGVDKKLFRMNSEHKDRAALVQRLNDLRQEMVGMENAVTNEDARFVYFLSYAENCSF
jgi:chromosome segregation ATPase